ncbi:hypothetical protein [Desulfotalea psychrophila]|uniref:Uncharacterized protein n=1 Tax=Desulfotalea psychrophila (strain LSv54 / DSM 12343) TaxID=177439 RepID=Q6AQX1_DESPS|nr:hypothetical protein [Desulfotalea psychrophila]CAG35253.1 unknown protein [Desulfotalea psychrophila LSv54]
MKFINSESLLDLLVEQEIISPKQRDIIGLEKGKQRQKLLRALPRAEREEKNRVDLVDVIAAFNFQSGGDKSRLVDEELIMRTVAYARRLELKSLILWILI